MLVLNMILESVFKRKFLAAESTSVRTGDFHFRFVLFIVMFGKFEQNAGFEATDIATKKILQSGAPIFNVIHPQ